MKKKASIMFSPIIYLILTLILLAVLIGVFFFMTGGSFKSLFGIEEATIDNSEDSLNDLTVLFSKCDPGESPKCVSKKVYVCNEKSKWELTESECP